MSKIYAVTAPDGFLWTVCVADGADPQSAFNYHVPGWTNKREIAATDLPPTHHRAYRAAWRDTGRAIECDMSQARAIARERAADRRRRGLQAPDPDDPAWDAATTPDELLALETSEAEPDSSGGTRPRDTTEPRP